MTESSRTRSVHLRAAGRVDGGARLRLCPHHAKRPARSSVTSAVSGFCAFWVGQRRQPAALGSRRLARQASIQGDLQGQSRNVSRKPWKARRDVPRAEHSQSLSLPRRSTAAWLFHVRRTCSHRTPGCSASVMSRPLTRHEVRSRIDGPQITLGYYPKIRYVVC